MIILSIDVGIRNLAACCIHVNKQSESYEIIDWNVFDLTNKQVKKCNSKNKKGIVCGKTAKYEKDEHLCCKTHAKATNFMIPTGEMKMTQLKKKRISDLYMLAKKHEIGDTTTRINKAKLLEMFETHIHDRYFNTISDEKDDNNTHLVTIGRYMTKLFNDYYRDIEITHVLIENQISPIANKMKTIQGMIAQYFIMSKSCDIQFISSVNKLKSYEGCKNVTYKDRKHKSIEICRQVITGSNFAEFFENHNKKDDLSDSYLQGVWYIRDKIFHH